MPERKTVLLRMRPDLYAALRRWADDEFRSVNGQIEYLLAAALRQAGRLTRPAPEGDDGNGNDSDSDAGSKGDEDAAGR
jgi:hypothetical protein